MEVNVTASITNTGCQKLDKLSVVMALLQLFVLLLLMVAAACINRYNNIGNIIPIPNGARNASIDILRKIIIDGNALIVEKSKDSQERFIRLLSAGDEFQCSSFIESLKCKLSENNIKYKTDTPIYHAVVNGLLMIVGITFSNTTILACLFSMSSSVRKCLVPGWSEVLRSIACIHSVVYVYTLSSIVYWVYSVPTARALDDIVTEVFYGGAEIMYILNTKDHRVVTKEKYLGSTITLEKITLHANEKIVKRGPDMMHDKEYTHHEKMVLLVNDDVSQKNTVIVQSMKTNRKNVINASKNNSDIAMRIVGGNVTFSMISILTNMILSAKEAYFMNGIATGSLAVLIATEWLSVTASTQLISMVTNYRGAAGKQIKVNFKYETVDSTYDAVTRLFDPYRVRSDPFSKPTDKNNYKAKDLRRMGILSHNPGEPMGRPSRYNQLLRMSTMPRAGSAGHDSQLLSDPKISAYRCAS